MTYPFAAVVGHSLAKRALLLLAVDHHLRGVFISSSMGTAKSILARAAKSILQTSDPRSGLTPPFVELPLGVSEDRLLGGLDFERSLRAGKKHLTKGLIAQANGGALYVDDINLLDNWIAEHLARALDAEAVGGEGDDLNQATGAVFMLIGSYEMGAGEVNPLLRARVGMIVEGESLRGLEDRAEIVRRVSDYQTSPADFTRRFASEMEAIRNKIQEAQKRLPKVKVAKEALRQLSWLSLHLGVEGHQSDIFALRVAKANAALSQRLKVADEDLITAIQLVLLPRATIIPAGFNQDALTERQQRPDTSRESEKTPDAKERRNHGAKKQHPANPEPDLARDQLDRKGLQSAVVAPEAEPSVDEHSPENRRTKRLAIEFAEEYLMKAIDARLSPGDFESRIASGRSRVQSSKGKRRQATKRRQKESVTDNNGRSLGQRANPTSKGRIAVAATLRAAAPFQSRRRGKKTAPEKALQITTNDLRYRRFKQRNGILFIFAIDASGSMALNRMAQAKGAMTRLLQQAYIYRDKVALISFRNRTAELLLAPTRSVELAKRLVDALPAGGATPLAAALAKAKTVSEQAKSQSIGQTILLLFTDGRANMAYRHQPTDTGQMEQQAIQNELHRIGLALQDANIRILVIDTKPKFLPGGEAKELAKTLRGEYLYLPRADDQQIYQSVSAVAHQQRQEH
jgi:magnesium chelatase subunit D